MKTTDFRNRNRNKHDLTEDTLIPSRWKAGPGDRSRTRIGLAAAAALAAQGAHVTLAARTLSEVAEAASRIQAEGGRAEALQLDVRNVQAVRDVINASSPFDVFVNNAGTNRPASFHEVTEEDFDAVVGLNCARPFLLPSPSQGN